MLCLCPPRGSDEFQCLCFPLYWPNTSLSSCASPTQTRCICLCPTSPSAKHELKFLLPLRHKLVYSIMPHFPYQPNTSSSSCCLSSTNLSYSFVPHFPYWPSMSSSSCCCCLSGTRHGLVIFVCAPIPIFGTCVWINGLSNSESLNFIRPPP